MSKSKISLERPPAVKNLWFLPDISEYKTLTQFPYSEEQIYKKINTEIGSLSDSSVRNMLSSQGIRRSDFKSKFLKPVLKALGPDGRGFFRQLSKSVFKKFPVQVRNTAEWLGAVDHLPDDNLFKCYIRARADTYLDEREQSMQGRTFIDTREELEYLCEFYSQHTNIEPIKLDVVKSKEFLELVEKKILPESLSELSVQKCARYLVALQQDFYLGLVSTLPEASVFNEQIFPRFIADSQLGSQASMVRAVLDWVRDELGFNSLDSFASYIASPPDEREGEQKPALEYDINYSKDKMKLWRKSSCNCSCAGSTECKHRGISSESMVLVSERLNTDEFCIVDVNSLELLKHAKMLDNLQADIIFSAAKDNNENICTALMKDEFRCNIERFHTYIDRYGI